MYEENGKPYKVSKWVDGRDIGELLAGSGMAKKAKKNLQKGFVMDALLGNWDVVGMDEDNIKVDDKGNVYRIDNGGSLRYRAMGKLKDPDQFGGKVTELDTMRDPSINPSAATYFGDIPEADILKQIRSVSKRAPQILEAAPKEIRPVLEERIRYLEEYYYEHSNKSKSNLRYLGRVSRFEVDRAAARFGLSIRYRKLPGKTVSRLRGKVVDFDPRKANKVAKAGRKGVYSTGDPLHPVLHEIGAHAFPPREAGAWDNLRGIARLVSVYAATSPSAFVGEVFAGTAAGKRYPAEVVELFDELCGYKFPS